MGGSVQCPVRPSARSSVYQWVNINFWDVVDIYEQNVLAWYVILALGPLLFALEVSFEALGHLNARREHNVRQARQPEEERPNTEQHSEWRMGFEEGSDDKSRECA